MNLDCRLDLKTIARHAGNVECNPEVQFGVVFILLCTSSSRVRPLQPWFAGHDIRVHGLKTTALIFMSGKMVVTGARSEDDSRLESRKYARIIWKLGFDAKFSEFKIRNIVSSCDVKFPIRLEGLAYSHGQFGNYEPEVCAPPSTLHTTF